VANARPAPAVAQPVRPSGPTTTSVARAATEENAINLRRVNLIGVYGSSNDRRALVRLSNGRYSRVTVGDRLDGGQVQAIGPSSLIYVKRGRQITLEIGG
jgi:type IV pilus biogenesis protein PilP